MKYIMHFADWEPCEARRPKPDYAVLQRYQLDPHKIQPRANAQQIIVANLDKLKPKLYE